MEEGFVSTIDIMGKFNLENGKEDKIFEG